jgi:hypothetical protein
MMVIVEFILMRCEDFFILLLLLLVVVAAAAAAAVVIEVVPGSVYEQNCRD